jgi:hypothetical protein
VEHGAITADTATSGQHREHARVQLEALDRLAVSLTLNQINVELEPDLNGET